MIKIIASGSSFTELKNGILYALVHEIGYRFGVVIRVSNRDLLVCVQYILFCVKRCCYSYVRILP
jgi:hypothetical protein